MPTIPIAQIQFAAGTGFMGGRAHVEVSGEFESDAGVNSLNGPRKWYGIRSSCRCSAPAQCQPNGCPGGSPMWINGQLNGVIRIVGLWRVDHQRSAAGHAVRRHGGAVPVQLWFGANGQPATPNRTSGGGTAVVRPAVIAMAAIRPATRWAMPRCGAPGARQHLCPRVLRPYAGYRDLCHRHVQRGRDLGQADPVLLKSDNLHIGCDNPFLPTWSRRPAWPITARPQPITASSPASRSPSAASPAWATLTRQRRISTALPLSRPSSPAPPALPSLTALSMALAPARCSSASRTRS